MKTYQTSDHRSLEIHKLIAKRLSSNPSLVSQALENIRRWKQQNTNSQPYLDEWLDIIQKGLEPLLVFLVSKSQKAARLRSSSPFTGDQFISQEERAEIFERFKDT